MLDKIHQQLKLFFSEGRMEDVGMNILGTLRRMKHGSQFVVLVTDRYMKLTKTIPITKMNATTVARIFVDL